MKQLIERPEYLENLISFMNTKIIKVVTGIRRCGKSTLFDLFIEFFKKNGVDEKQIIRVNLENPDYFEIEDHHKLYKLIKDKISDDKMNYIFIDEVQLIPKFQKAVDGLFIQENCDLYITGSNAFILSGELATLLSGRYVEIKMLPLSFKEYYSIYPSNQNLERLYDQYIHNSSFPYTIEIQDKKNVRQYLSSIYDSVVLKDIVARKKIANTNVLQRVIRFMFDNIGNLISVKKIADTLTSAGQKISTHTVETYLEAMVESFVMYRVARYDVKGRQHLKTGFKYYVCDPGLRYSVIGSRQIDEGFILENVVFLELLRRGKEVYIGKIGNLECDFIALSDNVVEYYQVAYTLRSEDGRTLNRELASLEAIKDHNPKYLLTMDIGSMVSYNGIKQINVLDWLLD